MRTLVTGCDYDSLVAVADTHTCTCSGDYIWTPGGCNCPNGEVVLNYYTQQCGYPSGNGGQDDGNCAGGAYDCDWDWYCGDDLCCCEYGSSDAPECGYYGDSGYCSDDGCCSQDLEDIVIAISGGGYSLTSPSDGVPFDMTGSGKKIRVAWTAAGSDTAFLALDRNGNGKIDDGTELFGNFAPQPGPANARNGFHALAVYDQPENGGNGDGWIDAQDAIYPKLLLWIDGNHNGISEPDELFTLPQLGIARISLSHQEDKWKDAFGNIFRRRAQIVTARSLLGKESWASDVTLKVAK